MHHYFLVKKIQQSKLNVKRDISGKLILNCCADTYYASQYVLLLIIDLICIYFTLKNRLQTCVQECSHRAHDRLSQDDAGEAQRILAQKESINCTKTCIDEQINKSIPAVMERVTAQLKKMHADQLKV